MSPGQSNEDALKWCRRCEQHKVVAEFRRNKALRDGLHSWCRACCSEYARRYQAENRNAIRLRRHKRYTADREKHNARSKAYYLANRNAILAYKRAWVEENRGLTAAYTRAYQASRDNRTPSWACAATLRKIYLERPDDHHVDHIIPLRGKRVSGLHVPENLQYLPGYENLTKNAQYAPQWEILRPDLLSW